MKKNYILLAVISMMTLSSCVDTPEVNYKDIKSFEIVKDGQTIDSLDVKVDDEIDLNVLINDNLLPKLNWTSADDSVVTIDSNGKIKVVGKGQTVISVCVEDYPYISDSIYIKTAADVEQLGVGSGFSADDPIFIGNEGEDEPLEINFIEMQQIYGDSILIKKGNVEVLIDAGYEYDGNLVGQIVEQNVTDGILDVLMVSHSDGDHIDGLKNALKSIDDISLMVDYGGIGGGNVKYVRDTYIPKGTQYYSAIDCVTGANGAASRYYLTSEFYFDVLNTGNYIANTASGGGNKNSLSVIFTYKDFTFFTAGDLTTASEADLLKLEDLPEVTLYKASHHGSNGSNSQELLNTLNPKAVAISCAKQGSYNVKPSAPSPSNTTNLDGKSGHPYADAISRIYKAPNISQNLNVYWSAVNGTMKFVSYGENDFEFYGSPTVRGYYDLTLTNGQPVWNEELKDFENKVTGEENKRLHETKIFQFRNYVQYLPEWARNEYFPNN